MRHHLALLAYLVLLHLLLGIAGGILLWSHWRPGVLLLEAALAASLALAILLLRWVRLPRAMVMLGTEWMKEGDFSHTFRPTGAPDLDRLVELYNEMMTRLREERARQEEQNIFLHKLLGASPSGILTTDHDGRIELANPAAGRLLEVPSEEMEGQLPDEIPSPLLRQLFRVPLGESRVLGRRGRRRLKCTHSHFFDRSFPRDFFVIEDLTHELWASEKLAYHSLIRTLSHEVNNTLGATNSILHSALAYGKQLQEEDREDFTSALQVAIDRTDHLIAFMKRYAEVARVPPPVLQRVDLGSVLERIARLMEPECRRRVIDLQLALAEGIPKVEMDVVQMEQVFVNVLRNAVEAVDREGRIRIEVGAERGRAHAVIEDSGPGLTPEAERNLFTPFFSTKPEGQGVGLTLVQEILSLHGFDFSLDSGPDEPTRFTIIF